MPKSSKQRNVVRTILTWYKRQGRTLPWRLPTGQAGGISNPYRILISEIMLQQTQVSRVLVKYPEFLRNFPTLRSLANAKQRDVVLAWQGMGYNNRAVRLHGFAQTVFKNYRGKIPQTFESLIALPGIGKYTANAMLSSAFGKDLPIVDVNVQRVFSRIFWKMDSTAAMKSSKEIWRLAEVILPKRKAYDWNQAVMDLGATVCTARNPKCDACPVAQLCASRKRMNRESPVRPKREPSLDGIPNRFYRGRIIERLRTRTGSVRLDVLGKAIYPKFAKQHEAWLRSVLSDLERDKLICVHGNGSLRSSRVVLV